MSGCVLVKHIGNVDKEFSTLVFSDSVNWVLGRYPAQSILYTSDTSLRVNTPVCSPPLNTLTAESQGKNWFYSSPQSHLSFFPFHHTYIG